MMRVGHDCNMVVLSQTVLPFNSSIQFWYIIKHYRPVRDNEPMNSIFDKDVLQLGRKSAVQAIQCWLVPQESTTSNLFAVSRPYDPS